MKPYYSHAGITIYHGDCREVLSQLGKVDAVITDPPYGMHKAEWDELPEPSSWLPMARCISQRVAIFCGVRGLFDYPKPDWTGAWVRLASTQRMGSLRGFNNWEPILFYGIETLSNDVISLPNIHDDVDHPTPKPEELMARLIERMQAQTVADPFMGSGTTLLAAKNLGRKAVGIEREEKYCEIAANRLSQEVFEFNEVAEVTA